MRPVLLIPKQDNGNKKNKKKKTLKIYISHEFIFKKILNNLLANQIQQHIKTNIHNKVKLIPGMPG